MKYSEKVTLLEFHGLFDEIMKFACGRKGRRFLTALKRFLRKEPDVWNPKYWEPWGEITYGYNKTVQNLKKRVGNVCTEAQEVLVQLQTTKNESTVKIQRASGKELGIQTELSVTRANKRIIELGFKLLTPEMAFNLYHQYVGEKDNDYNYLAMEPIQLSDGRMITFSIIGDESQKELHPEVPNECGYLHADTEFFFVCP